ncbi:hypothetical protein [Pseudonocardia sp. TRM90224]|uniref:hypothetical protein n=1 Tax=Pseudonocardia sp. TRM90224 TaxID=2812678 RepID=UPI001E3567ED|nr:hypothetical protein [Pseudonocardia sp. TRM90224]
MTMPRPDRQQDLDDPREEALDAQFAEPREPQPGNQHLDDRQHDGQLDTEPRDAQPQAGVRDADADSVRTGAQQPEMQAGTHQPETTAAAPTGMPEAGDADRMQPAGETRERLVPTDRATEYGSRWDEVKGSFVDEPRDAVNRADALVGELLSDLEKLFREQRAEIVEKIDAGESSTEDLRLALRRYRSLFDRLLSV